MENTDDREEITPQHTGCQHDVHRNYFSKKNLYFFRKSACKEGRGGVLSSHQPNKARRDKMNVAELIQLLSELDPSDEVELFTGFVEEYVDRGWVHCVDNPYLTSIQVFIKHEEDK